MACMGNVLQKRKSQGWPRTPRFRHMELCTLKQRHHSHHSASWSLQHHSGNVSRADHRVRRADCTTSQARPSTI